MSDIISGIYCYENLIDGKKYVGQAENITKRCKKHNTALKNNYDSCIVLQHAWNFHGKDAFIIYIIEECSIDLLSEREIFWIKELQSHISEWGYNISLGGEAPMRGLKHSKETIQKISDASKKQFSSDEMRLLFSNIQKGKKHSEESKKKQSEAISGENHPMWGKYHSEESKQKNRDSHVGKIVSEETKRKISNMLVGVKKNKRSFSKYIGVGFDKRCNKWNSKIRYNYKTYWIGYYKTEEDAALAYNKKATELYGEDAKLNIIK